VNKGLAIARLLDTPRFRGRRPAVFGDDLTDEAGFLLARGKGGVATIVGEPPRPTAADFRLPGPAAMRAWLGRAFTGEAGHGDAAKKSA
jgi:trehalose 6-phosphate phosphatase